MTSFRVQEQKIVQQARSQVSFLVALVGYEYGGVWNRYRPQVRMY